MLLLVLSLASEATLVLRSRGEWIALGWLLCLSKRRRLATEWIGGWLRWLSKSARLRRLTKARRLRGLAKC